MSSERKTLKMSPLHKELRAAGPARLKDSLGTGDGFSVDIKSPVEVGIERETFAKHGVVRQQQALHNRGGRMSAPINRLHILDLPLKVTMRQKPRAFTIGGMAGMENTGFYPPPPYAPREVSFGIAPEGSQKLHPLRWWGGHRHLEIGSGPSGRGSIPNLPVLMFAWQTPSGPTGLWIALEWSGLWRMEALSEEDGSFRIIASIPVKELKLKAGEKLELPSVHIGTFSGELEAGTNALRRYIRAELTPEIEGCKPKPFLAYDHWMGMHGDLDEAAIKPQLAAAADLGLEYFVIDAGWFAGMEKGWVAAVGNWETENLKKFPHGLTPLAEEVRARGMKFGLWFEPERAMPGTDWLRKHPDWFISIAGQEAHCLDLGQPRVCTALIEMLEHKIRELGIRWLRWDNNRSQAPYWAAKDPSGKYQFRYTAGLYRVWDTLRSEFPDLVLDLGWRMDFGALKRGATTIMADYAEDRHIVRAMLTGGARAVPANYLNGFTYQGRHDPLVLNRDAWIARMAGSVTLGGWISRYSPQQRRRLRTYLDGFRKFRGLLNEDFFPLTPYPLRPEEPDIVEYCMADKDAAVILAFTTEKGLSKQTIYPRGLHPRTVYRVTDPFSGKLMGRATGKILKDDGLPLNMKPHAAAVRLITAERIGKAGASVK
ncbi:glycoside hydrolase family 36 protein [Planctomycetota bacterium]